MTRSGDYGTSNQYIKYYIEAIQNWQDYNNNVSNVTIRVWIYRTNNYTTWGTGTVSVLINGTSYSSGITPSQKITMTPIVVFERTMNIEHNPDGTRRLYVSASVSHNAPFSSGWADWGLDLSPIPRASTPTLSTETVTMGDGVVTIYTNRASPNFTHTVRYIFGSQSGVIATNVGDSCVWTVPIDLANEVPSSTVGVGSIVVDTYNNGVKIGEKSKGFNAVVPEHVKPKLNGIFINELNQEVKKKGIGYVQNASQLEFVFSGDDITIAYNSYIVAYKVEFEGIVYNGAVSQTGTIKRSGSVPLVATITDSRGRTGSFSTTINVLPYITPTITSLTVKRANADGTLNEIGSNLKVKITGKIYPLDNNNSYIWRLYYRYAGTNAWQLVTSYTSSIGKTDINSDTTVTGIQFYPQDAFEFKLEVQDVFTKAVKLETLPISTVAFSLAKEGIGVGKIWEQGALDVAGEVYINGVKYENVIYGNNANGRYIRFPDGTQICFHESTTTNLVDTPYGSLFYTGSDTWTFPAEFISPPQFFVQTKTTAGYSWGTLGAYAVSNITASFSVFCATRVYANAVVSLMAIGRWK